MPHATEWVVLPEDVRARLEHRLVEVNLDNPVDVARFLWFEVGVSAPTFARAFMGKLVPAHAAKKCIDWYEKQEKH